MISMISAMDRNRNIGLNGDMPWGKTMKSDLRRFKDLTEGKVVVMGRKTYESIGRPLPNRTNIVMTTSAFNLPAHAAEQGCLIAKSVDEVLKLHELMVEGTEFVIIGGAQIYQEFMPYTEKIYLTRVLTYMHGDTKFPSMTGNWDIEQGDVLHHDGDAHPSQYVTYTRRG